MKKRVIASTAKQSLTIISAALLLAACGDEVTEVTNVYQSGLEVVDSLKDLPKCTDENEGAQALVKGEAAVRVCVGGEWFATTFGDAGDFNCSTEELKDGSGLKIVCNGDSIGVVLNGSDGKDAVLPGDTLEADSERVAVSLDSLAGYSQKGPFLKGSTVYLYELSDGRTLKQTNGNFTSIITRDDGRYKFTARDLASQYAMIVVEGYYRNEVTGKPSNASIRLRAITDMRKRSDANINLLTHLEFDRVYYLVTREKKTVKQAKKQAQKEIFSAFHIDTTEIKASAEDLDVFGKTDADAALLAISVLLQGDGSETDLSVLLTEIANDMETDGKWDGENADSIRAEIADWAATADTAGRLDSVFNHVKGWGLGGGNVPDFKKFVRNFWHTENKLGACGDSKNPLGTVKEVSNKNSKRYYAETYADIDITDVRFICDSTSSLWRPATNIEKDTARWGVADEGNVHVGQINRNLTYVFQDNHWRLGTAMDSLLKKKDGSYDACLSEGAISDSTYEDYYYRCEQNVDGAILGWVKTDDVFNETYPYISECKEGGQFSDGVPVPGRLDTNSRFVCDNGQFRDLGLRPGEKELQRGCVSYNMGKNDTLGTWHSSFTCTAEGWVFDDKNVFADTRDTLGTNKFRTYKTVKIGEMYWMAENLNFETDSSFCYNDNPSLCNMLGRLYAVSDALCYHLTDGERKNCEERVRNNQSQIFEDKIVQGVCPVGWHLPNNDEMHFLIDRVSGKDLKSTSGWTSSMGNSGNGTDRYGFNAVPAGYGTIDGTMQRDYAGRSTDAFFWTAPVGDDYLHAIHLGYDSDKTNQIQIDFNDIQTPKYLSVRCVMDEDFMWKIAVGQ